MTRRTLLCVLPFALALPPGAARAADAVDYNRDVRPILSKNCFACHGSDNAHRAAKLRLDQRASAVAKSDDGRVGWSLLQLALNGDSRIQQGNRLAIPRTPSNMLLGRNGDERSAWHAQIEGARFRVGVGEQLFWCVLLQPPDHGECGENQGGGETAANPNISARSRSLARFGFGMGELQGESTLPLRRSR